MNLLGLQDLLHQKIVRDRNPTCPPHQTMRIPATGFPLASKDASRSKAIRRWPKDAAIVARVKDNGRAEAALIAIAELSSLKKRPS
jgi:hypothetical protein